MQTNAASPGFAESLIDALSGSRALLRFALRMWASVCLALFVAFWLDLDYPLWAGTSAAVVCQPQLGASLRTNGKGVIADGTRIPVPNQKMQWDRGNPTGHGIVFIGSGGRVYCYVTPGRV